MLAKTSIPSHVIGEHLAVAGIVFPNLIPAFYVFLFFLRLWFPSLNQFEHFAECSNPLIWIQDFEHNAFEFSVWLVLYWSITFSFLNWDTRRRVSYFILALLVSAIGFFQWTLWFDSHRWLTADQAERYPMVNNLVERGLLNGQTQVQVIKLLGAPEPQMFSREDCMTFCVWDGTESKFGEHMNCTLNLTLNQQKKVVTVRLHNPYGVVVPKLP